MLDAKLLKPLSYMWNQNSFTGPWIIDIGTFEKRTPRGAFTMTFPMAERQGTVHLAFRLHRLDPSHRGLGYCSWKQDTKERYWGQQFCPIMERDSFGPTDRPNWPDRSNRTTLQEGRFPFNKNSGLKFQKFHVPNGAVHSGCTDPTQATARLVIVLVSRMQQSGTVDDNFVKWKGTFRSDRPKWPDRSN